MSKKRTSPNDTSGRIAGPASDDRLDSDPQFERLAVELSELPAALEPERDLWADVSSRLEPRSPRVVRFPAWRRVASHPAMRQALAAGLGLVAGAVLTFLVMGGAGPVTAPTTAPTTAEDVRLASAGLSSGVALDQAEMQFLRAKEELWLSIYERRQDMSPEAWAMVEQNLQILDSAVSDLRAALADDPGNPELERGILNNQRRSLDLLRGAAGGLSDSV